MKKIFTLILLYLMTLSASAIINGDGYYRVNNATTGRYVYILDDKGSINMQAGTAELGAIELWKGYERTVSDPSTVIYVKDLSGKKQDYDLLAQGTGVYSMINYAVSIRLVKKTEEYYNIFGRNSGLTRYLGDATTRPSDRGYMTTIDNNEYYWWYFTPITGEDDSYFGITGEFESDGEYYSTIYCDFPFNFKSKGMTAYSVAEVSDGKVYLKEIEGNVAAGTPVIIKTSSLSASDNRLNIGVSASPVSGNLLKGVYFCNDDLVHKNRVEYDKNTMRVLGKLSDGSIGFVTADYKYLPRNKAYLVVPAGTPAEMPMTTASPAGINDVVVSAANVRVSGKTIYISGVETAEVYNIMGNRVAHVDNAVNGKSVTLSSAGLYLVKAGSTVSKVLVR